MLRKFWNMWRRATEQLGVAVSLVCLLMACSQADDGPLPILGPMEVVDSDTTYHSIPDFRFVNQDSQWVTNETYANGIYVADFFFTSCPSICPKVKKQMLRMYDKYGDEPGIHFVSHSIDTRRDTVGRLKIYSDNLGVSGDFWHFLTGDKDEIFAIANEYFVSALEDPGAPGGFDHSGRLILVDQNRHIRSFCNGTDPEEVDVFMEDVDQLLHEGQ
jgi:protein SCO1/2